MRVAFNKEDIPMKMTIGHFLFRRLREIGVSHIFGVREILICSFWSSSARSMGLILSAPATSSMRPTPPTATRAPMALALC